MLTPVVQLGSYNTHDDGDARRLLRCCSQRGVEGRALHLATDQNVGLDCRSGDRYSAVAMIAFPVAHRGPSVTLDNVETGPPAASISPALGTLASLTLVAPKRANVSTATPGFHSYLKLEAVAPRLHVETVENWAYQDGYDAMRRI